MNAYEQMTFLVRLGFIIVCTVLIGLLFWMGVPNLENTTLQTDTLAGKVALGAPFLIEPGVISEEHFTDNGEDLLHTTGQQPLMYAVRVRVLHPTGDPLIDHDVHYNKRVWGLLAPQQGLRGLEKDVWELPATLKHRNGEREEAILRIEVYHE